MCDREETVPHLDPFLRSNQYYHMKCFLAERFGNLTLKNNSSDVRFIRKVAWVSLKLALADNLMSPVER